MVWAGVYTVGGKYLPDFLKVAANYSSNIIVPLSHTVPAIVPVDPANSVVALNISKTAITSNTINVAIEAA